MFKSYCSFLFIMLSAVIFNTAAAQVDPHTSQYYMNPLYINPANTGLFDGSYRVSAIYRNQWRSITNAFSTVAFSGDINTNKNLNVGINILSQSAGDAGYHFTNGYISLAYTGLKFGQEMNHHVSLGLQAGFISRRIDPTKFKLGDQWNPITGYNPGNITNDVFVTNASSTFDAGAGILYYDGSVDKKANFYGGFSAFHISKPADPFTDGVEKSVIPVRYAIHGGVSLTLSDVVTLVPNILYMRQGNAEEKMIGAYARLTASDDVDFLTGINYRFKDAVTLFAGFTYNNFTVGLSYDANTSILGKLASNANNFELTISYIGKRANRVNLDYLKCPRL